MSAGIAGASSDRLPIRLLVSDIDGTLVTDDKTLTAEAIAAAGELRAAGIALALVSARPAHGFDMLLGPLRIDTPRAGLNGGEILSPAGVLLDGRVIDPEAARIAIALLEQNEIETWIFGQGAWYLRDPHGPFVARERHAIRMEPVVVDDFDALATVAGKIMGSSANHARLQAVAEELDARLGARLSAHRSQPYYLDITDRRANKGEAALRLGEMLGVAQAQIACIGDMPNDIPMLDIAGLSIAMGNADATVRRHARFVTATNQDNGWARAVREIVLPRAPRAQGV